jgi:hypothetical protein
MEFLWTVSIVLESVAMLPQLNMFRKDRNMQVDVRRFIALRGIYRLLYIFNWVYRAHTEKYYKHHYIVYTAGVIQVLSYCDFWWYNIRYYFHALSGTTIGGLAETLLDATIPTTPLLSGDEVEHQVELEQENYAAPEVEQENDPVTEDGVDSTEGSTPARAASAEMQIV